MRRTAGRVVAFRAHKTLWPAQPVQGMLAFFLAAALLAFATGKATESVSTNPSSSEEKPACRAIGSPLPRYGRSANLSNG